MPSLLARLAARLRGRSPDAEGGGKAQGRRGGPASARQGLWGEREAERFLLGPERGDAPACRVRVPSRPDGSFCDNRRRRCFNDETAERCRLIELERKRNGRIFRKIFPLLAEIKCLMIAFGGFGIGDDFHIAEFLGGPSRSGNREFFGKFRRS